MLAVLGRDVLAWSVAALFLAAGVLLMVRCETWMQRGVMLVVTSAAVFVWLTFAPDVAAWAWSWRIAWRVWALGALSALIVCAAFLAWRMNVEIVNPNWPPPLNPRDAGNGGIGWPGTVYRDPGAPPVRDVPPRDPVLVYANNGEPREVHRAEIRQAMEAAGIGAPVADVTPEQRQRDALLAFIARGAVIGFSRRAWEGQQLAGVGAVSQQWWNDTTATLRDAGILTTVGKRTELACSVREALEAVR
jgi:hypothetical protein